MKVLGCVNVCLTPTRLASNLNCGCSLKTVIATTTYEKNLTICPRYQPISKIFEAKEEGSGKNPLHLLSLK